MDDDGVIRLRRVISKLARQLNASSTGAGLTPSQASVLSVIVGRGPLSLAELADLEGLNPTMLSRVVSKLQSMGLIDRIPDPADLRSASVAVTEPGRRIDEQVKAERSAAVSRGTGRGHARRPPRRLASAAGVIPLPAGRGRHRVAQQQAHRLADQHVS